MKKLLKFLAIFAALIPLLCVSAYAEGENAFRVNYYIGEALYQSDLVAVGEAYSPPKEKEIDGYRFAGWRKGSEDGELYEFSLPPEGDIDLFASYELLLPSFSLSSITAEYTGEEYILSLEEVSHPHLSEGFISYSWYKDGEPINKYGDSVSLKNVSDSGSYKCFISFSLGKDRASGFTPEVRANITKCKIDIPKIPEKYYSGDVEYPEIYDTGAYTVKREGKTEVGVYPIELTLTDSENYCFADFSGDIAYAEFKIKKAQNYWREPISVSDVYLGENPTPKAISAFGTPRFFYSTSEYGEYSEKPPTCAGEYFVKAVIEESSNYYDLQGEAIRFRIIEETVIGLAIVAPADKTDYLAFESFDFRGMAVGVTYNSGRHEIIGAELVSFSYPSGEDSFRYRDSGVVISYGGKSLFFAVNVKKAVYDLSGIVFADCEVYYDSHRKLPILRGALPVGQDGIPLAAEIIGGGVNAGAYAAELRFSTESENYEVPEPLSARVIILPIEREIFWENLYFVYDGELKLPSAYYVDAFGRKISLSVVGARSYAGNYTAEAIPSDANYLLFGNSVSFTVAKAEYDMSGIEWSGDSFVYTGEEIRVEIIGGLPSGVSVIGYADNRAKNAGQYTATVSFSYDERNYNTPKVDGFKYVVFPAEYPTSGFEFLDLKVPYDGNMHFPRLSGSMPCGADGIYLEYRFSEGVTHVFEGRCAVSVSFFTRSPNYRPPDDIVAFVEILPLEISVLWQELEFTYDGKPHLPIALSEIAAVAVSGEEIDAGEYIATAESLNTDYKVVNGRMRYEIKKAKNAWVAELSVDNIFFGALPAPFAEALSGEVEYIYFLDSDAENSIAEPRDVGKYFVMAYSEGGKNYLPIYSAIASFNILEILPVGIEVRLNFPDYPAFSRLSADDCAVYLLNNDGSELLLDFSEVSVEYPSGDSFRFSDSEMLFSYLGFEKSIPVSVRRAVYDVSEVRWSGAYSIYDGYEKTAILVGLPDGVSVVEYIGNSAVSAGRYPIAFTLSYDSENYEMPIIPDGELIIDKNIIPIPVIPGVRYTGGEIEPPIVENELYTVSFPGGAIASGSYAVKFSLKDSANYAFSGGVSAVCVDFVIEKIPIELKIADYNLYLFESEIHPDFEIISGEVIIGESLNPIFRIEGDRIFADFSESNYLITVREGRVIRSNSLSPRAMAVLLLIIFSLFCFLIAVIAIRKNRRRLYLCYKAALSRSVASDREKKEDNGIFSSGNSGGFALPLLLAAPSDEMQTESAELENGEEGGEATVCINAEYADSAISNSLAKNLIRRDRDIITDGYKRGIVNVDTLSRSFNPGDKVDINELKERRLIPYDTAYIKVLARGMIDKPLTVYANDFSLAAVKMIALSGGKAVKVNTVRIKYRKK